MWMPLHRLSNQLLSLHQQHQIGIQRQPCRQPCPAGVGDFIDARGVDQVHPRQPVDGDRPGGQLLTPGAAMGHIGGKARLSQQGIEQARLAHPHPAEHRQPQAPLLQPRQLLVQQPQRAGQQTLLASVENESAAPVRQQQAAALGGGGDLGQRPGRGADMLSLP